MSLFHPWALAAVAACSVALVAGPVSAWTRRYVRQPLRDYNDDSVDSATSDDDGRAHAGDDIIIASGSSEAEADDVAAGIIDAGTSRTAAVVGTRTRQTRRGQDQRPSPSAQSTYPTLRRPALLAVIPQSLLALALCGFCAWWGTTADALGATLVAVPVYAMLGSAASVDAVSHLLPNRLLGTTAIWLVACGAVSILVDPGSIRDALRAVLCALAVGAIGLLLAFIGSGLGLGDVKLGALIGLWLGWHGASILVASLCTGIILGGLAAILLLLTRRAGRKSSIAYGPYLIAGALMGWPLAVVS
ncbi:prepilin peptidase [Actinomyces massiliensis]|jgi:peptidase A24A prepilin type IV|uniref:Peptidase, A24 type IV prepilin peptidase family protein n=1 Tax=Actinomyces massiliensis F0489 TaxID=1125718 RepID=J0MUI7_9ACTO|nr:prepilin peptidase [Actinomyces massiliensis]EJF37984.1 peptidase, A24 type IV prepilin peptidase family protein [Actinomyces massiliensis F0489]WLD72325.1 prepilin peptidase [Actinomyces massiliensis]